MLKALKEYPEPDRKAPRFREQRSTILTTKFYKEFRKKHPKYKDCSNKTLGNIIRTLNNNFFLEAVNNRDGAELPESLGYIFIGSCPKPYKKNVDQSTSEKLGKMVTHRNFLSDSYLAKIFYTNFANKYKFHLRAMWKFVGNREFKNLVSSTYPENFKRYLIIENNKHISKIFEKQRVRDFAKRNALRIDPSYNEFSMD